MAENPDVAMTEPGPASAEGAATQQDAMPADNSLLAEQLKLEGNTKFSAKDYFGAIKSYTQAIALQPDVAAYYGNRAACYLNINRFREALIDSEKAVSLDPKFARGYFRAAKAQLGLGEPAAARSLFEQVLAIDPKNAEALREKEQVGMLEWKLERVNTSLAARKYAETLQQVDAALPNAPGSQFLKQTRALCLLETNKNEEALSYLTGLLRDDSGNPQLLLLRARALHRQGQSDQAIKHLQEGLRLDPDNTACRMELRKIRDMDAQKNAGNEAFKTGRYQDAIDAYTACAGLDPANATFTSQIFCNRAACFDKLKRYKEAIADCERAIALAPEYLKAFLRRADCYIALNDADSIENAIRDLEKAMEIIPQESHGDIKQKIRQAKLALKKAKRKDYYKILGVDPQASTGEITKAYRKAALEWHPDRHHGDEEARAKAELMFKGLFLFCAVPAPS
eukprot:TRINITY_DN5111_c0_g1_i1.p1 TRINITY_DN5111_c0_g1~~TRINITY_DN5111_c0_g1_i1.p1  ORF type:complete len:454 (-),score=93.91 TRINITY_DN5111_c0_g1_i1:371-1732(-)